MDLGYTRQYRKIWDNPVLQERGRPFSKREAFLYMVNKLASGVERGGLKRGEFEASYRYLAKAFLWDPAKVYRFMALLEAENMVKKVKHQVKHQSQHFAQHFIICNYETYNPSPNENNNTNYNTDHNKLNKSKNKEKERKETTSQAGASTVDPSPSMIQAERLSELLRSRIAVRDGNAKAAKLPVHPGWARDIEKLLRIDGRRVEDVEKVIVWCQSDGCWWGPNIPSGRKLREKFDTMYGQMQRDGAAKQPARSGTYVGARQGEQEKPPPDWTYREWVEYGGLFGIDEAEKLITENRLDIDLEQLRKDVAEWDPFGVGRNKAEASGF